MCKRMEACKSKSECFETRDKITGKAIHYLNSNSTMYSRTGEFNMSDGIYDENVRDKKELAELENKIKKLVGAQSDAIVIFNSGASESISTIAHWAKELVPSGVMIGSPYDHSAVKEAAAVYKLDYTQDLFENTVDDRVACIFMTQVNSTTGEIMDVNDIMSKFTKYSYLTDGVDAVINDYSAVLQFKPLFVADITQSVTKVPISMSELGLNAVFFSTHKIGGKIGHGILVINQDAQHPFIPLVAGAQNHGLRGGSMSAKQILEDKHIYDHDDTENRNQRKNKWVETVTKLRGRGVDVYEPKGDHLYNTILLDTHNKCPFELLDNLTKKGVYMSSKSACMMDSYLNGNKESDDNKLSGGVVKPFDNAVRISFITEDEITNDVIDMIADEVIAD